MRNNPKVYGFAGLLAILGLVALLIGLVVMLLLPDIRYAAWGILALGVILLAVAFALEFRQIRSALAGRRGRFSTGTTVMASIFIGIILVANAISVGSYKRFDLTGLAQFTLTSQTKDVLSKLEAKVNALFFYGVQSSLDISLRDYVENLLNEYKNYTDRLNVKFIDADEQPDQARKYGVTQYSTVVFESENRRRLVVPGEMVQQTGIEAEHAFTSAILEVTGTVQKKVYFLVGHDEADIISSDSGGYSNARGGLLDDLYLVDTLNLITSPKIPEDCAVLVIAGPRKPLSSSELDIIVRYLLSGGQALILANPDSPPELKLLVSLWGIELESGTIIDPRSYVAPKKDIPSVTADRNAFGLPVLYFPGTTAVIPPKQVPDTMQILPLLATGKDAWLERDFDPQKEPAFNAAKDLIGPLSMGLLVAAAPLGAAGGQAPTKLTRLAVIGDSDFASNQHFNNGNNGDLFLNSVKWLAEETELIAIRRTALPFRRLVAGPEVATFINYSSIGLLPLVVLIIGGIVWWRRR